MEYMQFIAVGQPLFAGVNQMPEITEYNFRAGNHILLLSMKNLCPEEIAAVNNKEAEFGLYCENNIVFLLYRFGDALPWSDAGYSWWNVAEEDRELPFAQEDPRERALLNIILVEAASGVVKALRVITFSPDFTNELHCEIRKQAAGEPVSRKEFVRAAFDVYQKYNSAELAARATVRTKGGE